MPIPDWISGLDYGDVPTWFASVATSLALLITVRTVSRDQRDRHERDKRAEGEQARAVLLSTIRWVGGSGATKQHMQYDFELEFTNASEDVIHDVEVGIDFAPESLLIERARENVIVDHLAVGESRTYKTWIKVKWPETLGADDLPKTFDVAPFFRFSDIEGRRWERDASYRLTRL